MTITSDLILNFQNYLVEGEKSLSTQENYIRSVNAFNKWMDSRELSKQLILEYKNHLVEKYKIASVNGILSALNAFFEFVGASNLKIKTIKKQKEIFSVREKELTKDEYKRLLETAWQKGNQRLYYIILCKQYVRAVSEFQN